MTITTVTSFADAPEGFKLPDSDVDLLYSSPADIPVELFVQVDSSIMVRDGTLWPYWIFNAGVTASTDVPVYLDGTLVDPADTSGAYGTHAVRDHAGNSVGTADLQTYHGYGSSIDVQIGGWAPDAVAALAAAPTTYELVYRGVATIGNSYTDFGNHQSPRLRTVVGFRPRADWIGEPMVFIDNLAFFGNGYFQIDTAYNTTLYSVPDADRNLFAGFLKRTAMDKAVRDLSADDVAFGVLQVGASVQMIVNGAAVLSGSIGAGAPFVFFDYEPVGDMRLGPVAALDAIPINVTSVYAGATQYNAAGTPTTTETLTSNDILSVNVAFAGTVVAMLSDMDLTGKPTDATYWQHGYHSAGTRFDWFNSGVIPEGIYGMFYPAPPVAPFWTNKIKTTEIA